MEHTDPSRPAWARHVPEGTDPADVDLLRERSLPAAWARRWADAPSAPVLHDADGWITAAELEERSRRVAGRLLGAGLVPGDRVLTSGPATVAHVVAHVACLRAGLTVVPTNPAYRDREIGALVLDSRPHLAIVADPDQARLVRVADPGLAVVGPDVDLPDSDPGPLDRAVSSDAALIAYTSGTTGEPKGAVLTHGNLLAGAEALRLAWRWVPDDRLVLALPLFHMHGLGVGLHGTLLAGASAVLLPRFEVDAVLDAVRDHAATLFFGVPTMYARLAESDRAGELGRLRLCVSGSAPLPPDLFDRLREATGRPVLERYGMTETLMLVSNPYEGERRAGTVGFPLPGVDLRLDGAPDAVEILVRGPNVFARYHDRPDETVRAFDQGWFRTGDLGTIDADGHLRIVGRSKDIIITGGYNVAPREVEEVLRMHPAVLDVAVTGTPSDEWGEVVTAWVVAADDVSDDELLEFAAARLARYKRPRLLRRVDALPRNALGKVQKHLLVDGGS